MLSKNGPSPTWRQRIGGGSTPALRASARPIFSATPVIANFITRRSRWSSGLRSGEQVAW